MPRKRVVVVVVLLVIMLACQQMTGTPAVPSPTAFLPITSQLSPLVGTPTVSLSPTPTERSVTPTTAATLASSATPTHPPLPAIPVEPTDAPPPTVAPPTATVPATDTPAPEPPPPATESPPPATDFSVSVWETQITLATYAWEAALLPTEPGDPVYPYPRLDHGAVGGPAPRAYTAIILENGYTRVTVIPELGGRILRWDDLRTGQRLTYTNPVIKPTQWGYRGWWFATGGIEWAFPTDEHGLNEWRPWQYQMLSGAGWRGVRVWDTDDRTGLTVEVTLRLTGGRSDLIVAPRITNPTGETQVFQFWSNAMLTLSGGNAPSSNLRFWVPTEQMIVHSTNDGSLPGPGSAIAWPLHNGRDFGAYATWQAYLGLFAAESRGAVAAYDTGADQGIVRAYPATASGVKLFCLGNLPASLYTDDGSRYFELWGGYTRTFWDNAQLAPGGSVAWEERWYPVHGIGDVSWASGAMAASLRRGDAGMEVGLYAPAPVAVRLVLRQQGAAVAQWDVTTGPDAPFRANYPPGDGAWDLQIWEGDALIAQIGPP